MAAAVQVDPRAAMAQRQQQNDAASLLIRRTALEMIQPIFSQAINPANQQIVSVQPTYAGLLRGFFVEVSGTIRNTGSGAAARTNFGTFNLLSQIQLIDLQGNTRINTTGWHLGCVTTAKNSFIFGGSYAGNVATNFGNNWNVNSGASSLAAGNVTPQDTAVRQIYYVPAAYSNDDLRGSIYLGVVNATMQLLLTINSNTTLGYTTGTQLGAVYGGANTIIAWNGNVQVNVWQSYLDQLPTIPGQGVVLPTEDMNQVYELKQVTPNPGLVVGSEYNIPYTSFRTFLSSFFVFDNGGTFNSGSDLTYFKLQASNFTPMLYMPPELLALLSRQEIMTDWPPGTYYLSHRKRPLNTLNFGNLNAVFNPSVVNTGAVIQVGYEDFSVAAQAAQAPNFTAA